jgi:hypothetical protein
MTVLDQKVYCSVLSTMSNIKASVWLYMSFFHSALSACSCRQLYSNRTMSCHYLVV